MRLPGPKQGSAGSGRRGPDAVFAAALFFLAASLAIHVFALWSASGGLFAALVLLAAAACVIRPKLLAPALLLLGSSLFLFGFHPYRPQTQALELAVAAVALALLLAPGAGAPAATPARRWLVRLWLCYLAFAAFSLLRLPPDVLAERAFLEGAGLFRAVLDAYPSDPLYSIAAVLRLGLFGLFALLLASRPESPRLCRALLRGIAIAAVVAVVLGLLDFAGAISLAEYNLSRLFYGSQYRRLQSTFSNPSWFACFVTCALPFVLLELGEARPRAQAALAVVVPACAVALFLSGARAAWITCGVMLALLGLLIAGSRRLGRPLPALGRPVLLTLGVTLAGMAGAAAWVFIPRATAPALELQAGLQRPAGPQDRIEGLASEMRLRGVGLDSPRSIAARYALELASQAPVFGLGHETFNLHLRAQLAVPSSPVAQIENVAARLDPGDAIFDDAHNTYLQVLVGTGVAGLIAWLALGTVSLGFVIAALRRDAQPRHAVVLLAMLAFHWYGLFQGMQYIPATWLLLFAGIAHAMTLAEAPAPPLRRILPWSTVVLALAALVSPVAHLRDRGERSFREAHGLSGYLPDETSEFVGFYRPEVGPSGEFRWMARRGIVRIARAVPFRLTFTCDQPDLERDPVIVSLAFEGRRLEPVVFRRSGAVVRRFQGLGPGRLRVESSRTHKPASGGDRRERGVSVSAIDWE